MPFKHHAARRHHIGKMQFKMSSWAEYEAGLRRRGNLTLWITPEALSSWQVPKRKTRGGQPRYSDLAIQIAPALQWSFRHAQTRWNGRTPIFHVNETVI